ncbi:MAG: hypothetical protein IRZ10_02355 [Thermoflavifilum sp.]|nr:hypothetical protein [Thermoflavifilum sp.]MCL6513235.1 hypothetical protein [Alicyclobacillus sp.]
MRKTLGIRYVLFGLLFLLCIVGLCLKSYPLLGVLVILAIVLGVIGDKIENAPTEPFKRFNELHHLHGHDEVAHPDGGSPLAQ